MSRRKISEEMKSMRQSVDEASKSISEFAKNNDKAFKTNEKLLETIISYANQQKKANEEIKKANEEERKRIEAAKNAEKASRDQQRSIEKLSSSINKLKENLKSGSISFDEFEKKLDEINKKEKEITSVTEESKEAYSEMKESLDELNEASSKMAPNKEWIKLFDKIKENNKVEEETNKSWEKRVQYASALQKALSEGKISKEEVNQIDPNAIKESENIVEVDKAIKGEKNERSAFGEAIKRRKGVLGAIDRMARNTEREERKKVLAEAAKSGNKLAGEKLNELKKEDSTNRISKAMDVFEKLSKKAFSSMVKYFKEAWQTALNAASYSSSTTLISNSSAREQQLEWGLSDSQNYAFTQTKSILGISSTDDIYYMNPSQRAKFYQLMEKYSSFYDQMNSSGTLASIQELQIDMAVMKQEFISELVSFISEHKSEIISAVRTGMIVLKGIFSAVVSILNFFGKLLNVDTSGYESAVGSVTGSVSSSSATSSISSSSSSGLASGYSEKISSAINSYRNVNDASYNTDNSARTYNITINNEASVTKTGNEEAREITDSLSNSTAVALMNYLEG